MPSHKVPADWSWLPDVGSPEDIKVEHVRRAAGLHKQCACKGKTCASPFCNNFKLHKIKVQSLEELPKRENNHPVGLKNLGATCYANAFIQVWFQDRILRAGVYGCKPSTPDSPIQHLAVTFAALEHSTQSYYNPASLVESLRLEKGSQQDASEFSKLFMSLISQELEFQTEPRLRTLIKDRFEGRLAYSTLCQGCGVDSERENAFTELELGLAKDESLSDRLEALLADELLDGDNKYRCSQCDDLCAAKRRIKLKSLPPVLSFSLLRFVFDPSTFNRKKCKDNITFPGLIDMGKYIEGGGADWYELSAIVTHCGANAQSGHFVCEVYDVGRDKWFLFNDEVVEEITKPGNIQDKVMLKMTNGKLNTNKKRVQDVLSDGVSHKRQKTASETPETSRAVKLSAENQHSSKDAYLLLYTRHHERSSPNPTQSPHPEPSPEVLVEVQKMNDAFQKEVQASAEKRAALERASIEIQLARECVIQDLAIADVSLEYAVSTADLKKWLSEEVHLPAEIGEPLPDTAIINNKLQIPASPHEDEDVKIEDQDSQVHGQNDFFKCGESLEDEEISSPAATVTEAERLLSISNATFSASTKRQTDNSHLTCEHGQLSPWSTSSYKLVSKAAQERLSSLGYLASPTLAVGDLCRQCIIEEYDVRKTRLAKTEEVRRFAHLDNVDGESQFLVSKTWVASWRKGTLPTDQMTGRPIIQNVDPYKDEVYCQHDLKSEASRVQTISAAAYAYLQELLPGFLAPTADEAPCSICSDLTMSYGDGGQESVAQAKLEKSRLKLLTSANLNEKTNYSLGERIYLVPCDFIDQWRAWQQSPQRKARPTLDTSSFFCEHALLRFDPFHASLKPPLCWKIPGPVWDALTELYGDVQDVNVTGAFRDGAIEQCNAEICTECHRREASTFVSAQIIVNLHSKSPDALQNGGRARSRGRSIPITVIKGDTVLEIKRKIAQRSRVQPWLQRLFLGGKELVDHDASTTAIGLLSTDHLDMLEVVHADDDFEVLDHLPMSSAMNGDQGGFDGTALVGGPLPKTDSSIEISKACPTCTFSNGSGRTVCEMCEARL